MNASDKQYLSIKLKEIEGYTANDVSTGDLNGDGKYDLIVHMTGKGHDNSQTGITDPPIFQDKVLKEQDGRKWLMQTEMKVHRL
jgi:rhamnogalacturonan endolyase